MGSEKEPVGELILGQIMNPEQEGPSPTVLSCGGIYIPHRSREEQVLYNIITTSNRNEPVKVVTGVRPRNQLYEVLFKESLN